MPRPAVLDDPEAREAVVQALCDGLTVEQAASRVGISGKTITRYAQRDSAFGQRVAAAQSRREVVRDQLPAAAAKAAKRSRSTAHLVVDAEVVAERAGVDPGVVRDGDRLGGPTTAELIELLWGIAQDPDHRACGHAIVVLSRVKLEPILKAQERRAEIEAAQALEVEGRPATVLIELPPNGTEAPGREPQPAEDDGA